MCDQEDRILETENESCISQKLRDFTRLCSHFPVSVTTAATFLFHLDAAVVQAIDGNFSDHEWRLDQASDSEEVVTPLMLDGTYLSRNFATLGPLT